MTTSRHGAAGARADADLVHDFLSGNSAALGDLYDRFAPGLYDTAAAMLRDRDGASDVVQDVFCVAATKLGQLRDPTRVKPWLYAIARHEIFRRTKQRSRSTSLDVLGDEYGMDPMASPDPHAEAALAESQELASLVRDAAFGLDPTDQLLLELTARQGLVGAELAAAIGVPVAKAHSMVFRMRERLERAVGAVVVTRGGRKRCEDLAAVLVGWDGRFDVLWRKRISRHIDDCDTCQATRKGAAIMSMAGFAPAFALPAMLRERTLSKALSAFGGPGPGGPGADSAAGRYGFDADGFPVFGRRRSAGGYGGGDGIAARSLVFAVAGTMVAAMVIVLGMVTLTPPTIDGSVSDDVVSPAAVTVESTLPETTAESTSTSTSTSSTSTSTTTTTSTTTSSTVPAVAPPPPPTAAPPPSVVVTPPPTFGTTPRPTTTPAPMTTTLPPTTTTLPPTTTSTTTTIATTPSPPQIRSFTVTPTTLTSCGDLSPDATASVFDRDGNISSVTVSWSGRMGSGSNKLQGSGTQYAGQIGPFPSSAGAYYTVTLTVIDTTGLKASSSTNVGVGPC